MSSCWSVWLDNPRLITCWREWQKDVELHIPRGITSRSRNYFKGTVKLFQALHYCSLEFAALHVFWSKRLVNAPHRLFLKYFLADQAVCALRLRCMVDSKFSRWRRRSRNFAGYMLYFSIDTVLSFDSFSRFHKLIFVYIFSVKKNKSIFFISI